MKILPKAFLKPVSVLLVIVLILSVLPAFSPPASALQEGDFTYKFVDDGANVSITKYTGTGGAVVIPDTIEGKPVTDIGVYAFSYCTGLSSVTLPDSVTKIGLYAFENCTGLSGITIPDSVTFIMSSAFSGCTALKNVTIGTGVTTIAQSAFAHCTSLTQFDVDAKNTSYTSVEGVLFSKDMTLIQYPVKKPDVTYKIPEGVTGIGGSAFSECAGLSSVSIPGSVTKIGEYAFVQCAGLSSVSIPDSVAEIGRCAFLECSGLVSVNIGTGVSAIGENAFAECKRLTRIDVDAGNTSYTSVEGVLFSKNMTLMKYPEGKTAITYKIPEGTAGIGGFAFIVCDNLTGVTLPDSVTSVEAYAFNRCKNLNSVTIGKGVAGIALRAFNQCTGLAQINVGAGNTSYTSVEGVLFSKDMTLVKYPEGKTAVTYKIPEGATGIGTYAFWNCTNLNSVVIPGGVTGIGAYAFLGCTNLSGAILPDSVISIGMSAFSGCINLSNMTLGNRVTVIDEHTFADCKSLKSVTIPDSVTTIKTSAFSSCTGLKNVRIGNSVASIGMCAFSGCTALNSVTIGKSVASIEWGAFLGCTSLTSAYFYGSAPVLGNSVFDTTAPGFKVYYLEGAAGFTTPYWNGYPTALFTPPATEPCDLFVSDIGTSPVIIHDGDKVTLYTVIRNQSNAPSSGNIQVDFYVDGMLLESVRTQKIVNANGFTVVTSSLQWNSWMGSHSVRAVVNGGKTVPETNYSNNTFVKRIKVYDYY